MRYHVKDVPANIQAGMDMLDSLSIESAIGKDARLK
jgi:hypothetical protein